MHTEFLTYLDDKKELEGYLASPQASGSFPLVLIVHAWGGRDEFVCKKAEVLANLGYAGFAVDMFGKGVLGRTKEEKQQLIKPFLEDRAFLLKRLNAAVQFTQRLPMINRHLIIVMGYCFGGLCALDLARHSREIKAAVSFHGLLSKPEKSHTQKITAKILALHGYADPMVPPAQVQAFENEMEQAGADWQIHTYGHIMHAFTNPEANDSNFGTVYNQTADQRSWKTFTNFLDEICIGATILKAN